ncbi:MAG: hypothetical protein ACLP1W_20380 [Rhodomicrobium sp.]
MKYAYKVAPAALILAAALASPAAAAAPGPIEALLSAPFLIGANLVNMAVSIPASLSAQPHRARSHKARRVAKARGHHRKRHEPAYRFKEPIENF